MHARSIAARGEESSSLELPLHTCEQNAPQGLPCYPLVVIHLRWWHRLSAGTLLVVRILHTRFKVSASLAGTPETVSNGDQRMDHSITDNDVHHPNSSKRETVSLASIELCNDDQYHVNLSFTGSRLRQFSEKVTWQVHIMLHSNWFDESAHCARHSLSHKMIRMQVSRWDCFHYSWMWVKLITRLIDAFVTIRAQSNFKAAPTVRSHKVCNCAFWKHIVSPSPLHSPLMWEHSLFITCRFISFHVSTATVCLCFFIHHAIRVLMNKLILQYRREDARHHRHRHTRCEYSSVHFMCTVEWHFTVSPVQCVTRAHVPLHFQYKRDETIDTCHQYHR